MVKAPENTSNITLGTAYEINKNLVEKYEKELTLKELQNKKTEIINFIQETKGQYYMLLCNDKKDYTIFNILNKNNIEKMTNILVDECLINRGIIKGIDLTKDKCAIEIWLSIENEAFCYYFFKYDDAVIEI